MPARFWLRQSRTSQKTDHKQTRPPQETEQKVTNLDKILAKANERLLKLEEKKQAIAQNKRVPSVKSALKALADSERNERKTREDFVKDCLTKRDLILQHRVGRKWNRIRDVSEITKRAILEARETLAQEIDRRGISIQVELVAHNLKRATAQIDLANVQRSLDRLDNFNDDVRHLILGLLESPRELTVDDMRQVWKDNFAKSDIQNLCRGTTVSQSIDFHAKNFVLVINEAKDVAEITAASEKFRENIKTLFKMYFLDKVDVDSIIKFNI